MKMQRLTLALLAGLGMVSAHTYAATAVENGGIAVQFELAGSCTLDTSAAGTTYATFNAPYGTATNQSLNATVTVNCTAALPYRVGAKGGNNLVGEQRNLSNGTDTIPYTVRNGATEWGDADISGYDTAYFPDFTTINAESRTGTGADEALTITYEVTLAGTENSGQYSDALTFVVAWP
jgi:spore coat protein U-like protein